MTQGSTTYSGNQIDAAASLFGGKSEMELKKDKTGTLKLFGSELNISSYDDKNLIVKEGEKEEKLPYTVNGNRISIEESGIKMVFEKK